MSGDELIDDNNLKINKRYCCVLHHENIFEGLFNCYLSAGQWILVFRKKVKTVHVTSSISWSLHSSC